MNEDFLKQWDAFSVGIERVIEDELKFKNLIVDLGLITEDQYPLIKKAEMFADLAKSSTGGAVAGGLSYFAWYSALGFWGKCLLAAGWISSPLWIFGIGAAAVPGTYLLIKKIKKYGKKVEDNLYIKLPRWMNGPIDYIAHNVAQVVMYPFVITAYADGFFNQKERKIIEKYLSKEKGFNKLYISKLFELYESGFQSGLLKSGNSALNDYRKQLNDICKMHKFDYDKFKVKLLQILQDIMGADGIIVPKENDIYKQIEKSL